MAKAGELFVALTLRDIQYIRGLNKAEKQAARSMRTIVSQTNKAAQSINRMTNQVLRLGFAMGTIAAAAGFRKVIKDFAAFETALTDTQKITNESMESIRAKVEDISEEFGTSTELVKGYYQVLSAGVREPVRSLETLTIAAQASKAAHVEQAETVKALTKLLNTGLVNAAKEASDALFAIEKVGQTTFGELVPVIGTVANLAAELNVNMNELAGTFATVTQVAGSVEEAATQQRALFLAMLKPTDKYKEVLKEMRIETSKVGVETLGLNDFLKKLIQTSDEMGISTAKLVGRQRGLLGLLAIARKDFADLDKNQRMVNETTNATTKAFARWKKTLDGLFVTFKNLLTNIAKLAGMNVAERIKSIVKNANEWLTVNKDLVATRVAEWINGVIDKLQWIVDHKDLFKTLFAVILTTAIAARLFTIATAVGQLAIAFGLLEASAITFTALSLSIVGLAAAVTTLVLFKDDLAAFFKLSDNEEAFTGVQFTIERMAESTEKLAKAAKEIDTTSLFSRELLGLRTNAEITSDALNNIAPASLVMADALKKAEKASKGVSFTGGIGGGGAGDTPMLNAMGLGRSGFAVAKERAENLVRLTSATGQLILNESIANAEKFKKNFDVTTVSMSGAFIQFGNTMSNVLANSAFTAGATFRSIAQSFTRMLAIMATQLAAKAALFSVVAALFPGSAITGGATLGAGFGSLLKNFLFPQAVKTFGDGGMAMKPQLAIVGDSGPERILNPQETREFNSNTDNSTQTFNINMTADEFNLPSLSRFGDMFREAKREGAIKPRDLQ